MLSIFLSIVSGLFYYLFLHQSESLVALKLMFTLGSCSCVTCCRLIGSSLEAEVVIASDHPAVITLLADAGPRHVPHHSRQHSSSSSSPVSSEQLHDPLEELFIVSRVDVMSTAPGTIAALPSDTGVTTTESIALLDGTCVRGFFVIFLLQSAWTCLLLPHT
jgi:hypothetical protein